jgi:hypothetical protein
MNLNTVFAEIVIELCAPNLSARTRPNSASSVIVDITTFNRCCSKDDSEVAANSYANRSFC